MSTTTEAPEYHGPTPIFYGLMQEQAADSYVRRLLGNGNELDQATPAAALAPIEGTLHGPGVYLPAERAGRFPGRAVQGPHTATIVLPGGVLARARRRAETMPLGPGAPVVEDGGTAGE